MLRAYFKIEDFQRQPDGSTMPIQNPISGDLPITAKIRVIRSRTKMQRNAYCLAESDEPARCRRMPACQNSAAASSKHPARARFFVLFYGVAIAPLQPFWVCGSPLCAFSTPLTALPCAPGACRAARIKQDHHRRAHHHRQNQTKRIVRDIISPSLPLTPAPARNTPPDG